MRYELPELWHSADELRDIARSRGLSDEGIADLAVVRCAGCGISAVAGLAFAVVCGGIVHFPDCDARAKDIRFIRRSRTGTGGRNG